MNTAMSQDHADHLSVFLLTSTHDLGYRNISPTRQALEQKKSVGLSMPTSCAFNNLAYR